jgi:hypothetical protein
MGRRRRNLRTSSLAVLMLVGLFLAWPASSSGGRERDLKPRPSCPSAADGREEDINGFGTPNGMSGDCIGALFPCFEYQAY